MNERYTIFCNECGKAVELVQDSLDEFHCPNCKSYYCSEDGVMDNVLAREMQLQYKGAKLAGLIKEPDVPREQYHSEWRD